uniref:Peptidase M14 domain-containing protein n=1 Tax=Bombyx mori TaxID=7091 RepID=A0A8R2M3I2_BOMMO|nr:uncharacterized protein LOC101744586 [Bombyx mori]
MRYRKHHLKVLIPLDSEPDLEHRRASLRLKPKDAIHNERQQRQKHNRARNVMKSTFESHHARTTKIQNDLSSSDRDHLHVNLDRNAKRIQNHNKMFMKANDRGRAGWPKLKKNFNGLKSRRNVARSTQMTPVQLLQHASFEDSTDTNLTKGITSQKLSPYTIKQQILEIMSAFPNANVTYEVIGRTASYNDILLLKVTELKRDITRYFRANKNKYVDEIPEKKVLFIVHGLNILGINNLRCLINTKALAILLSYYFEHLDKFDIFFIPLANPDGYTFLGNSQHIWNKNIAPQNDCPGVFLDRNFDVAWNVSSINSCSQLYPGEQPFSEVETRAIRGILHRYSHKIIAYFNVHVGSINHRVIKGDAVLYPNGYTDVQIDDDKYFDLKAEIEEAMKNSSFQNAAVQVETLQNWYGKISGTSVDYASTIYGIPFAMELVMQTYANGQPKEKPSTQTLALSEIWKRVIDTTFNFISRRTNNTEME